MSRPRIAITMGDPAGVGPELCARLLHEARFQERLQPVVFGDATVLRRATAAAGIASLDDVPVISDLVDLTDSAALVDLPFKDLEDIQPGQISAATGAASMTYLEAAIAAAQAGSIDGVTTGPIHKLAWQQAGIPYPGHTELFAERFDCQRYCMMMTAPAFSCSLVTTHVGYHEVPQLLSTERILEVTELTGAALEKILDRPPRLLALGLNPHAGEGGLFGQREEERLIAPAVEQAQARGWQIEGPLPPDTAFLPWRREQTDGYICMYHDQGLIPFKAFNFDTGVNITLGLPQVRTSVDHGTALDIAWQGKAEVASLLAAVDLAARLSQPRRVNH